jgi:hypothetical protein
VRNVLLLNFLAVCALAWLAVGILTPSGAHAQQADSAYLELISQALGEYDEGHWPEARALFERAHAVEPNARTQRGIGLCAFAMRDYVGTIVALEASLADTRRPLEPTQRAQVEELLGRARVFVATMRIESDPAVVTIEVDGYPPVVRDGVVLLNPGRHESHVTSDDHDAETRVVEATTNSEFELRVELVRRQPVREALETRQVSTAPWYVVAGGGTTALAGSIVLALGRRDHRRVDDAPEGTPWVDVASANDRAPRLTGVGTALLALGVAGIGAGITWVLIRGDGHDAGEETTSESVTVGLGSIRYERRF